MDDWDPLVTNGFALDHDVILFNNAGVASSGGETPGTVLEMTQNVLALCRALGLKEIDAVGFSLGGMIAQELALHHPNLLRRIILLGTGPRDIGPITNVFRGRQRCDGAVRSSN
jgi:pimeloyl-ACP methyl ester carboxylesterase